MQIKSVFWVVLAMPFFLSCENEHLTPITVSHNGENYGENYYDGAIQFLFNRYCLECHDQGRRFAGLVLQSWEDLIRGSKYGEVVIPYDSENSLMIERMTKFQIGAHGFAAPHPGDHWKPHLTGEEIRELAWWIDNGAKNSNGIVPYKDSQKRLYVCNERAGLISVIDTDARLVIRNIKLAKLGYPADSRPYHIVAEPETGFFYVSLYDQDRVLKLNADYRLEAEAVVTAPGMMVIDPGSDSIYVAHFSPEHDVPNSLAVLRRSAMVQMGEIELPLQAPYTLAVDSQANGEIYAASFSDNRIVAIDPGYGRYETTVLSSAGEGHTHLVIAPKSRRLYVPAALSNELLVIDLNTGVLISKIPVGEMPWQVAIAPDGVSAFVCNLGSNSIAVIDTKTLSVKKEITGNGLAEPNDMAISADGKFLFVSNRNASGIYQARRHLSDNEKIGTIMVINTATYQIEKVIEVEEYATAMALSMM